MVDVVDAVTGHRKVNQPTAAPTTKMMATGITGIAATILVLVADGFGYQLDPALAAALVGGVAWAAGYMTRSRAPGVEAAAQVLGGDPPRRIRRSTGD